MGSSSRKYGCEYMYTDIQLSDWCVCPRVCPNTYYFTTHISYEKEKCTWTNRLGGTTKAMAKPPQL